MIHIVIAKGSAANIFNGGTRKDLKTVCGKDLPRNPKILDDWWNNGEICAECYKVSRVNEPKKQKHYIEFNN